ncbi:MAG: bifunctional hydroxymethylpyrimidine kinase/phosphomethylpyrimidine kinase [Armatimonadetes bacterium]|nr:bifunctional hydroxymethylpyrimidine kinase/phosphomethylpyrimidine kinase [Armatimonadota bacterium]
MTDHELVLAFEGLKIAVIGDLMMDEYVWGDAARVSPESPVLVIEVRSDSAVPGGAANVAANAMALGAQAQILGVVGEDVPGTALKASLEQRGANISGIVTDPTRPTTRKTRIVAQNQQVLRIDRESSHETPAAATKALGAHIASAVANSDAILVSDYAKGVVNAQTVPNTISLCQSGKKLLVANAKPDNVELFAGASVVSLNVSEAVAASGDARFRTDEIEWAGKELRKHLKIGTLIVTRGPLGITYWTEEDGFHRIPAHPVEVYDVAGAGDTVITTITLALAAGAPMDQASRLAVRAAAIVVGKVGVATVTANELLEALG